MILTRYDLQGQGFLLIVLALKNTGGARVDRARSQKPGSGACVDRVLSQKFLSGIYLYPRLGMNCCGRSQKLELWVVLTCSLSKTGSGVLC